MSIKDRKVEKIEQKIRRIHEMELGELNSLKRVLLASYRWILMLYHEVIKDDVTIRAESLSYFTLFSILPLMAGVFLLLGFFSQWSPVQKEFQDLLVRMLQPIPEEHRTSLIKFILEFKDQYLLKIDEKSSRLGVFALGVLIWITAKVFFNIEALMNRIWSVGEDRSWLERIQNFVFGSVILPFFAVITLSIPRMVQQFGLGKVGVWSQELLPNFMVFCVFVFIFKFFPNLKVRWRNAIAGASLSIFLFAAANLVLKIYFKFGTDTAYGKAGALPIVAFFIYVLWLLFIIGAELSYLMQNQADLIGKKMNSTTLSEAALMMEILGEFKLQFQQRKTPLNLVQLAHRFQVSGMEIEKSIHFLKEKSWVGEVSIPNDADARYFVLLMDFNEEELRKVIQEYLKLTEIKQNFDIERLFSMIFIKGS